MKNLKKYGIGLILIVLGVLIGYYTAPAGADDHADHAAGESKSTMWTCSMHPSVMQDEPGLCPLCEMDLIPADDAGGGDADFQGIEMSEHAVALAKVQTSKVRYLLPQKAVRLNGKIEEAENADRQQAAHFEGRIEEMRVRETGQTVNKGQVVAVLYAPSLMSAQRELLEAYESREERESLYKAARQKLKNRKITDEQIDEIINRGKATEFMPLLADASGVVTERLVNEGDYLTKGQNLYTVNSREQVWAIFDVYEEDFSFVNRGDSVTFTLKSLPGEEFSGAITFIDPEINEDTRTVKARVVVNNPSGKLYPGMLATGTAQVKLVNEEVPAIPSSAVLWTGERSLVYVRVDKDKNKFEPRQVKLGSPLGDGYIVKSGLKEGEEIVTNGAFSVDAAAQLAGKPSMMNDYDGTREKPFALSANAKKQMNDFFEAYLTFKDALVETDFETSKEQLQHMKSSWEQVNMNIFEGASGRYLKRKGESLNASMNKMRRAGDIADLRTEFKAFSEEVLHLADRFPVGRTFYKQYCPMADDDRGAYWLSGEKRVANPYYGDEMLRCGTSDKIVN